MSADEIRRLAKNLSNEGEYGVGKASLGGSLIYNSSQNESIYAALLAYAAMVERCEKIIMNSSKYTDTNSPGWTFDLHVRAEELCYHVNYILRGDAGKEER